MQEVLLRYHGTSKTGKGSVGFIFTDEQWEYVGQRPLSSEEFKMPKGLWLFVILHFREILGLEEGEIPQLLPVLWRPKNQELIPKEVTRIDLSRLPIEVWHPESPPVGAWPFPHPSVSDTS